jgi:hypothetical protein
MTLLTKFKGIPSEPKSKNFRERQFMRKVFILENCTIRMLEEAISFK